MGCQLKLAHPLFSLAPAQMQCNVLMQATSIVFISLALSNMSKAGRVCTAIAISTTAQEGQSLHLIVQMKIPRICNLEVCMHISTVSCNKRNSNFSDVTFVFLSRTHITISPKLLCKYSDTILLNNSLFDQIDAYYFILNFSGKPPRQKRTQFMTEQTAMLEMHFTQSKYLTRDKCKDLGWTLLLKEDAVTNWFKNRRVKERQLLKQIDNQNATAEG